MTPEEIKKHEQEYIDIIFSLSDEKELMLERIKALESAMREFVDKTNGRLWDNEIHGYRQKFRDLLEDNE